MPGTFSPPPRVSDPDIHHGTCVTHVPWSMPGSLTSGFLWDRWRGKRSRHPRCMRKLLFYVSGRRPIVPFCVLAYRCTSGWMIRKTHTPTLSPSKHSANLIWGMTSSMPKWVGVQRPFYWHGITLVLSWVSNRMPNEVWDEITYPFPNFNGASYFIIKLYNECGCISMLSILVKWAPDVREYAFWFSWYRNGHQYDVGQWTTFRDYSI